MDMSWQALFGSMSWGAKAVVIVMFIMSIYSIWVMVERYITFTQAKNQSLKLLGALSNLLTKGDYQQAIDVTKKYKQSHLAKVISAGLLEFEAARRDKRFVDPEVPVEAARQGMDRTAMITVAELKENLGVLATIGAVAPMVARTPRFSFSSATVIMAVRSMPWRAASTGTSGSPAKRLSRRAASNSSRPAEMTLARWLCLYFLVTSMACW